MIKFEKNNKYNVKLSVWKHNVCANSSRIEIYPRTEFLIKLSHFLEEYARKGLVEIKNLKKGNILENIIYVDACR